MPKQKITKEMVVDAAFELAKEGGMEMVLVKNIAEKLGCSVQPIYSYCESMEGLKQDLMVKTADYFRKYVIDHLDRNDVFRSTGKAYISLSKEEPNLFRLYFMRKRTDIVSIQDLYNKESNPEVTSFVARTLHISIEKAKELHLHMIIYTMGIAFILATSGADIPAGEISAQMDKAYRALAAEIKREP